MKSPDRDFSSHRNFKKGQWNQNKEQGCFGHLINSLTFETLSLKLHMIALNCFRKVF